MSTAQVYLVVVMDVPRGAPQTARARVVGVWPWSWAAWLHHMWVRAGAHHRRFGLRGRTVATVALPVEDIEIGGLTEELRAEWMEAP